MQTTTAVRLERILVAVDFFPPSKHALRYAVHFAKLFEPKLFWCTSRKESASGLAMKLGKAIR